MHNNPYHPVAFLSFREPQGEAVSLPKPKTAPSKGKQYVLANSNTLYHHLYSFAWRLEDQASYLQYSEGYLFEEVRWIRESAEAYKAIASQLLGVDPLEWWRGFEGVTCEIRTIKTQNT